MDNCIFCRIVSGSIPAKKVLETPEIIAFHDIRPQAPVHVQLIPRRHIATLNDLGPSDQALCGDLVLAARRLAGELGLSADGYRLVFNCGKNSGQEVFHIHLHLLGGRAFGWPPG